MEFHSVSIFPYIMLPFLSLRNATPSRNLELSTSACALRPSPLFLSPPSLLSFLLSFSLLAFDLPFISLFGISRGTMFTSRLCCSQRLPAIRIAAARKCNKRRRGFTRTVKWHSVSYCGRTSILVFADARVARDVRYSTGRWNFCDFLFDG